MLDAVRVLEDIGVRRSAYVRSALRTLLVHRKDDLPVFDEAFQVFWRQRKDRTSTMDLRSMGEQRRYRRVEGRAAAPGRVGRRRRRPGRGPGGGRRSHRPDAHVQRPRGAAGAGLRRLHAGGGPPGEAAHGVAGLEPRRSPDAAQGARQGAGPGRAKDAALQRAVRRRAGAPEAEAAQGEASKAGGHLRRERLHGALHADAGALPAQPVRRAGEPGRGLPVRHPADAGDQAPGAARHRPGRDGGRQGGAGLVRRDAHRRGAGGVQLSLGAAGRWAGAPSSSSCRTAGTAASRRC